MDNKTDLFCFILISLVIISLCITNAYTAKVLNNMNDKITALEEQNNTIIYKYDLQKKEIETLKQLNASYASETDAKLNILAGDVQELKLEKETKDVELHQEPKPTVVGTYELTAYIATGNPCADGVYPQVGYTAACNDPKLWHKWVHIDGYGDYYIHDTGGMANNVIDLFVGSHDEAIQFGRRSAAISIIDK